MTDIKIESRQQGKSAQARTAIDEAIEKGKTIWLVSSVKHCCIVRPFKRKKP